MLILDNLNKVTTTPAIGAADESGKKGVSSLSIALLLTAVFFVLCGAGIVRHECWRDELNAWMVAHSVSSVQDLSSIVRYEGHPILWYLSLFLIERLTADYHAMQAFHLVLATGAVYFLARYSPFSGLQKLLLILGYFPLYEYGIVSRCYAMGNLALFAFCAAVSRPSRNLWICFGLLSVLANTSIYGTILALAFAAALTVDSFTAKRETKGAQGRIDLLGGLLILAASVVMAIFQMLPPIDGFHGNTAHHGGLSSLLRSLNNNTVALLIGYVPVPHFGLNFWSTSPFADICPPPRSWVAAAMALFGLFSIAMARRPLAIFAYVLGTTGILLFSSIFFTGTLRHYGELFMLLVACLWVARQIQDVSLAGAKNEIGRLWGRAANFCFTGLLLAQAAVGIYALGVDIAEPFSQVEAACDYIKEHNLQNGEIIAYSNFIHGEVQFLLGRRVHFPPLTTARTPQEQRDCILREFILRTEGGKTAIVVTNVAITNPDPTLAVSLLKNLKHSIVHDEGCYIYSVRRKS